MGTLGSKWECKEGSVYKSLHNFPDNGQNNKKYAEWGTIMHAVCRWYSVLIENSPGKMSDTFAEWGKLLSKGLRTNRDKIEYIKYSFGEDVFLKCIKKIF